MMLPIGNSNCTAPLTHVKKRGFSLIELMVATAILSLGIVVVFAGFLLSVRGFNYAIDYLSVQYWIDEKIWGMQDELLHRSIVSTEDTSGVFVIRNKQFSWNAAHHLIEGLDIASLYEIAVRVTWQEGKQQVSALRTTYVLLKQNDE